MNITLSVLPEAFGICRLDRHSEVPDWAHTADFCSITRTIDELSIICAQRNIPHNIRHEKNWKCVKVEGYLDFSSKGIFGPVSTYLEHAKIDNFTVSTYNTDYLFVKKESLNKAILILVKEGFLILDYIIAA